MPQRRVSVRAYFRVIALGAACSGAAVAQAPDSYLGWEASGAASYNPFVPAAVDGAFGAAIGRIGDVDGDGVDDLLVQSGQGAFLHVRSGAAGTSIFTMFGVLGSDLGRSVVRLPDLDGDGVDDFGVGAPGQLAGFGASQGRFEARSGATGIPIWAAFGGAAFERFGECAAVIGDVDGDAIPDVAVGAPGGVPFGGAPVAGSMRVLSGATGALMRTITSPPGFTVGRAVAHVGDVDGDGVDDAVFTASLPATGGPITCGNAFASVLSGATGAPLTLSTGSLCDAFGFSAAGLGDVNGDGVPDYAIGSPDQSVAPTGAGVVAAFSGATGATLWTASIGAPGAAFGASLVGAFDFDGDGDPDLAVTAPDSGVTGGLGKVAVLDAATGAVVAVLTSQLPASPGFGVSLAAGSDWNGDGVADVAAGAPLTSTGGYSFNGVVTTRSRYGLATGGARFGGHCFGGLAAGPVTSYFGGGPTVAAGNGAFGLAVTGTPPFAGVTLMLGFSNTSWAGGVLPFNLAALGVSACPLLVSPDLVFIKDAGPGGSALFPFPFAPTPALSGLVVHAQAYVGTGTAPFQGGTTGGLTTVLQ